MKCTQVRIMNTVYEGKKYFFLCIQLSVSFFLFVFKYSVGCCTWLLLHSSLVANGTWWQVGGDEQDYRRRTWWGTGGGGGVAKVMRVEHARSPLLHPDEGDLTEGWEDGRRGGVQYYLLLLDMAYWACFCWRSSVMASSFFNTCCREETGIRSIFLNRMTWIMLCQHNSDFCISFWPAVLLSHCSASGARLSVRHRPHAAQPGPVTGLS